MKHQSDWAKAGFFTILLLCMVNVLNYVDRQVLASVLNEIGNDLLQSSVYQASPLFYEGILAYAFMISYIIFAPLVSYIVDSRNIPRKWVIVPGVILWSIFTGLGGLVHDYNQLLITRILVGIGEACFVATAPSLISDYFPIEKRGRILMWFYLAIPLGAALGFIAGSNIAESFSDWRWAFFLVGFPGILLGVLFLWVKEPQKGASHLHGVDAANAHKIKFNQTDGLLLVKNRSFVFVTLGMTSMTFAMGGLLFFFLKYFQDVYCVTHLSQANLSGLSMVEVSVHHFSHGQAGLMIGGVTILAGIIGTMLGGILSDHFNKKNPRSYFWVSGITMILGAPFAVVALSVNHPWVALLFILMGEILLLMNTAPSNAIILNVTVPTVRTLAFSLNTFFLHALGDAISPPMIGIVTTLLLTSSWMVYPIQGFFWALMITPVMMVLSGIFFLLGAPYYKKDVERVENRIQEMLEK